ncbi:geranylgeranylglyceryl/heptaprenylglyceryl phosphate synthase [Candidatus Bathyarchaeota archaeon]|nr:geranylgeranylglyceryl/heptaprenylglyceryl phosphate synthase [Candidatus Bathyarchaeota archaeon]
MSIPGKIEHFLTNKIRKEGTIHLTLVDPEKVSLDEVNHLASVLAAIGTTGVMVGGSTLASTSQLDDVVQSLKKRLDIPVILFPNNVTAISRYADAILFMSLLNSNNPLFITGFQALAAPIIKRYNLEAIPLGYIIVGEGSTAAYIGQAHEIPLKKPEVAALYALAAQYIGMRFVYLEAGSGADIPVPPEMIRYVVNAIDIPVIVGGGIRTPEEAGSAAKAGASVIVTGTIGEEDSSGAAVKKIIASIK